VSRSEDELQAGDEPPTAPGEVESPVGLVDPPLLEVDNLQVAFETEDGLLHAVDGVSLRVDAGRTLGIVGESGCGKSVTASAILRLVPIPPGRILGGQIRFDGTDILGLTSEELTNIRGNEISMIFQDPMTSLNPVFTVERQMGEVLKLRFGMDRAEAFKRSAEMLGTVGIADPEDRLISYPHELSGGMKQRVMIAMALLCEPKLLIADEPTTALDVTIQAQILRLIKDLQNDFNTAVIFITHDMGVIAEICDQVAVMYAGRVVEQGDVVEIFEKSKHPYTKGLLDSIPRRGTSKKSELPTIEGLVPSLLNPPDGCRFAERCGKREQLGDDGQKRCFGEDPRLRDVGGGLAACHFPLGGLEYITGGLAGPTLEGAA
jgi:oligopeptide/dipeptide ABC transporter ATP-binding protein